ncbi:hypothetical protein CHLNCDRAFT_57678 [Chlorella variabilis]|uniref:Carbohydrate kinase PfkB domain-containing protein n=1 Tax=Chlorella variabilis TaxID=554065 RepID=E1ZCM5_CHLVA|nr:hypothetical protein CHLNCDRAFT_57678 [Chlorella variabilis]EFN56268.1 hypothetical protein CHLNCDRAFT_57678 [Chlorella variabilis]|eukprot:XP_005848370.1 hypothetical protein CHLNCDRAFT_57678 [Chlorella variabilis]
MQLVFGLGDPVLDIVARVDHSLLERLGMEPGGCVPVSAEEMGRLLALPEVHGGMKRVPGGSAANVLKGLASLAPASLSVAFVGMVGQDEAGWEYRQSITAHGVRPLLLESGTGAATAACLCLVTPDGQRTMRTALCAALELSSPQQLPRELAPPPPTDGGAGAGAGASGQPPIALLHCEGYCLYRVAMAAAAMRAARARGARVSLDLASFEVVANCWTQLGSLLQERLVDIIFCNEQEAAALCQAAGVQLPPAAGGEQVVAAAHAYLLERGVGTIAISRGSKGCSAKSADGSTATAAACRVAVVDTVGAGDYFTSGVLLGLLSGASLQASAACGCTAGTAAVRTAGAELGPEALQQLRAAVAAILAADKAAALEAQGAAVPAVPLAVH